MDFVVEQLRFLAVAFLHGLKAALSFDPLQGEHTHIDRKDRGRIVHALSLDMNSVIQHGVEGATAATKQVLANDDQGSPGGPHVFLCPCIYQSKGICGDRPAKDIRRHIANHGHRAVRKGLDLGPKDGVVGGKVEIVRIGGDAIRGRDVGEVLVLRGSDDLHLPQLAGILNRLGRPGSGIQVSRLAFRPQQIHRDHGKLQGGPSLKVQDLVFISQSKQTLDSGPCFVHHALKIPVAVGYFDQGEPGSLEVQQGRGGLLDDRTG